MVVGPAGRVGAASEGEQRYDRATAGAGRRTDGAQAGAGKSAHDYPAAPGRSDDVGKTAPEDHESALDWLHVL